MEKVITGTNFKATIKPINIRFEIEGSLEQTGEIKKKREIKEIIEAPLVTSESREPMSQSQFLAEIERSLNQIKITILEDLGINTEELKLDIRTSAEKLKDELQSIDEHQATDVKSEFEAKVAENCKLPGDVLE